MIVQLCEPGPDGTPAVHVYQLPDGCTRVVVDRKERERPVWGFKGDPTTGEERQWNGVFIKTFREILAG